MQKKQLTKSNTLYWEENNKIRIEGDFLNQIKGIYEKPTANNILNGKRWKISPLISESRQGCPFLPFLISIVLEVLGREMR